MSTPAIVDGRVFVLGPWGHIAALDAQTGAPLWTVHAVDDLGSEKPFYGFGSSPVVVGDTVVLPIGGEAGAVAGFDAATGALRWRSVEDEIFSQSAVVADLAGRRQVLVLASEEPRGPRPRGRRGALEHRARREAASIMGSLTQSPLVVGKDRVFVKQDDSGTSIIEVTAGEAGMSATRIHEGHGPATAATAPPTVWGGQAYGYTNRLLSALDLETGELLWRSRDPGDGFLVAIDGQLAVLTKEGSLHLGPASPEGWEETTQPRDLRRARLDPAERRRRWPLPAQPRRDRARGRRAHRPPARRPAATGRCPRPSLRSWPSWKTAADPAPVVDRFLADRELPLVDGEEVVFLWRGDAQDVAVAGDMIGIRREEAMRRLEADGPVVVVDDSRPPRPHQLPLLRRLRRPRSIPPTRGARGARSSAPT